MDLSFLAAAVCGVLSGLGVGGGSLLMIWMTVVLCIDQRTAQGINLLYFLPTAAASLLLNTKNRLLRWDIALSAIPFGCLFAVGGAMLAMCLNTGLLRKLFGAFLIFVSLSELKKAFTKEKK